MMKAARSAAVACGDEYRRRVVIGKIASRLKSLLGHASPEIIIVYTDPLEEAKRQALADLARLLFPYVRSEQRHIVRGSELIQ